MKLISIKFKNNHFAEFYQNGNSLPQGNRIKIPPSFCIRQCGEDIFTTMLTAVGNKWGIVCKKREFNIKLYN